MALHKLVSVGGALSTINSSRDIPYLIIFRFIHCTPEEVEEYKRTGQMSNQILAEATRKNQLPGNIPICNQFKKGLCRRNFCKYRHLTKEQEEAEILELVQNNSQRKNPVIMSNNNSFNESQLVTLSSLNSKYIY